MESRLSLVQGPVDIGVRDAWMSYACSQTEQLLPSTRGETTDMLATKRDAFLEHLNAVHATESLLRQRMNTLAPIYRLADETLAHILTLVCASRCPEPRFPIDLMLVSTRLCAIIRTYPGVWSHPPLPKDQRSVDALLSHVKAAPLHLDWRLFGIYVSDMRRKIDLATWMPKCQTLALHATTQRLRAALTRLGEKSEAPLLESMSVTVDRSSRRGGETEMIPSLWPSELFSNSTPCLHKLRLIEFGYLRWTHPLLCPTLTHLEITCSDKTSVFSHGQPQEEDLRQGGCSYNDFLDMLERLPNLRNLILTRCVSTVLLFGGESSGRRLQLEHLRYLHISDSSQACSALCQNIGWTKSASVLLRFAWSEHQSESVSTLMRSLRLKKGDIPRLDVTVSHRDDGKVPHKSVRFEFNPKWWGRVCLEAIVYRPRSHHGTAKYLAPSWYREPWTTMASSLPLQRVMTLRIHLDQGVAVPSKSVWLESFSHASWVTDLRLDNALVPTLAVALGKQPLYERNVDPPLFPRLAHILLPKVKTRDIELLQRAVQRRAPRGQMILGRFIIDADNVKRKAPHPPIVFVEHDGTRVPVRAESMQSIPIGTSREWFDVRKALQAQSARRRARNANKSAYVSPDYHIYSLQKYTCFRHKHAQLQSTSTPPSS